MWWKNIKNNKVDSSTKTNHEEYLDRKHEEYIYKFTQVFILI